MPQFKARINISATSIAQAQTDIRTALPAAQIVTIEEVKGRDTGT
jgi:hypothetical protein